MQHCRKLQTRVGSNVLGSNVLKGLLVATLAATCWFQGSKWILDAWACGGDPPPPRCAKTFVFSVGVPGVVKNSPEPITLEFPAYTFLSVIELPRPNGLCPRPPYRTVIDLRLECPGQDPLTSTTTIDDLPRGHSRHRLSLVIPPGPPRKCRLVAKATVIFSDGMRISRTVHRCICIVDCSDKDPSLPRLDLAPVIPDLEIAYVHPGDQTSFRYRICNNDPLEVFVGRLDVVSANESQRPVDESPVPPPPGSGVFGLSDARGDAFPIAFRRDLGEDCIRLPLEPQLLVTSEINRRIVLQPCEWVEVEVVTRPWGMCANGSCGGLTLTLSGEFADGTPGLGCASAVVVGNTLAPPQYAWPDSGRVACVQPAGQGLVIEGLPSPDLPPTQVQVETEIVSLELSGPRPQPIPIEPILDPFPIFDPQASEKPEKGRIATRIQLEPTPQFHADSFFDIFYEIHLQGPPGSPPPQFEQIARIPNAPAGFENRAPLAMGVIRAPAGENFQVDSFFDVTYQIHIDLQTVGADGETRTVETEMLSMDLRAGPNGGAILQASARGLGSAVDVGEGGAAGLPPAPVVGVVIRQDLAAFARLGIAAPCPPTEVVDLRCEQRDGELCMAWGLAPPSCQCDSIRIRTLSGQTLAILPGNATSHCIPCPEIEEPQGTVAVECLDENGEIVSRALCEYDCREDPCPRQIEANCDPTGNGLVIAWSPVPDDCCTRFVVYPEGDPGNIIQTLPAGSTFADISCEEILAAGAPAAGRICLDCVEPDGDRRRIICCQYECEDPCPPQIEAACDPTANGLVIAWSAISPACCTRFVVYEESDPGNVIAALPAGTTFFEISCDEILAAGAPAAGKLCLDCVEPDGDRRQIICCDYECDDPCDQPIEANCDPTADGLVIAWSAVDPDCCQEFIVYEASDPSTVLLTLPAATTFFEISCDRLRELGAPPVGQLCIACVEPTGRRREIICCDYECDDPCPPLEIQCEVVETGNGPFIVATWTPPGDECCDVLRVFVEDTQVATLAPDIGQVRIPCTPNIPRSGVLCVRCYDDGQVIDEACCDYECPPDDCPPLELLRCEQTPNGLAMLWSPIPDRCCQELVVQDGNGTIIDVLPTSATSFTIPCDRLVDITGARSGIVCIVCIAPDGTTEEICCEYSCLDEEVGGQIPGDCNQDGQLDLSDAICLLRFLFLGTLPRLPCGDGSIVHPSNILLLDWNGDGSIDLADVISGLRYLFFGGPRHPLGTECVEIPACPDVCRVP